MSVIRVMKTIGQEDSVIDAVVEDGIFDKSNIPIDNGPDPCEGRPPNGRLHTVMVGEI